MDKTGNRERTWAALKLVLPMSLQYAINQLVNIIDNLMAGSLGDANISAISVCWTYSWLNMVFTTSLTSGMTVVIAKLWGAKKKEDIKRIMSLGFVINLAVCLIFFLITSLFPVQILRIYSDVESIIEPGQIYLNIMRFASFLNGMTLLMIGLMQSVHEVKLGFSLSIVSCFVNLFLNYALIFGKFGFSAMGIAGVALATLVTRTLEFVICVVYIFFIDKNLRFRLKDFDPRISKELFMELVGVTVPVLLIEVQSNLASSVQTIISGHISEYYISANSIVHMSWMLTTLFTFGLNTATNILVGNAVGAGDRERTVELCRKFMKLSIGIGVFASIIIQGVIPIISSFYNVADETLYLSRIMGYAASANVLFLVPAYMSTTGIYKVVENSRTVLILNIIGVWCIALPLGALCAFVLKTSPAIIYFVLRSGNMFNAIVGTLLLKKKNWI